MPGSGFLYRTLELCFKLLGNLDQIRTHGKQLVHLNKFVLDLKYKVLFIVQASHFIDLSPVDRVVGHGVGKKGLIGENLPYLLQVCAQSLLNVTQILNQMSPLLLSDLASIALELFILHS